MSNRYPMQREKAERVRSTQFDAAAGIVYVYVRFDDRVDVHKFTKGELDVTKLNGHELIEQSRPAYRVSSGHCTCRGYEYRGRCRHVEWVAHLSESDREGWRGAAK